MNHCMITAKLKSYNTFKRKSKPDSEILDFENPWQVYPEIFSSFSSIIIFYPALIIISVIFEDSIAGPSIFVKSFIC